MTVGLWLIFYIRCFHSQCKWIPRRDNSPKILAQIHKEAEIEEQERKIQQKDGYSKLPGKAN